MSFARALSAVAYWCHGEGDVGLEDDTVQATDTGVVHASTESGSISGGSAPEPDVDAIHGGGVAVAAGWVADERQVSR
ncbi:MAG: hypothetical protein R3F43_26070 [bacterium]